ncbi:hypothetical protein BWQ96_08016 [Gracilariopsis chorda]|uniref:Uncharacterized protein n=1 Tax=Gracilariopsis chorda TaxID=448386 RepID=A0A2V3IJP3_9FLOR|nr:hypothetical protein BWQ96_08016 [Gracilariopsis chorda]|eukprot:PXF42297.1 hypothetical protein BWQ96_08016 [Gracilariopsis chorda]
MDSTAFTAPLTVLRSPFVATPLNTKRSPAQPSIRFITRADLNLKPGIPSGQDPQENAPIRYYVPRPKENYDNRGFATVLPRNWEGEVSSIGAADITPVTKESIEESRKVKVTPASTSAFLEYSQMVKEDREKALAIQKDRSEIEKTGRATCGEEEGKAFVSNYQTVLVEGVKAVEYWGVPNGPVPRLFGGPGE